MLDPVEIAKALIACPSVTPARGAGVDPHEITGVGNGPIAAFVDALAGIGFTVHRFAAGEPPDGPVENLFAIRGAGGPHFAFAGHLDVVPAGEGWTGGAFAPEIRGGLLHGRGAVDMKSAIAAFAAAAARIAPEAGTLGLIVTGDEEGPAIHGTRALIDWMAANGHRPELCLVGEPTSSDRLGDMMKIGRRGSVNMWIEVAGREGHVAYPHLADNPIPALVRILAAIDAVVLDAGTEWFQPSNIEITDIEVGNPATNVIPPRARARLSIRFNDRHRGEDLVARIRAICEAESPHAALTARISGEAFLTPPGEFSALVARAIEAVTGMTPQLSTTGGTSDARFLSKLCPVVEFGLPNATMHKRDEAASIADIAALTDIYERIIRDVFRPR